MSTIDQCPSTLTGEKKREIPAEAPALNTIGGRKAWRSLEEFSSDPSFKPFVEREFPAGASELFGGDETRRTFLKLMGASAALAGAATLPGCRRPDHKILAYSAEEPEQIIPGKPLYFATSMPTGSGSGGFGAEGLLVETHQGRPTKIEGNPMHPVSRGKSTVFAQAEILRLYDPDRLKNPVFKNEARGRLDATWDDFAQWWETYGARHQADRGAGLAFVVDRVASPTMDAMRNRVLAAFPRATWVWWDAIDAERSAIEGSRMAFGRPMRPSYRFDRSRCVLSLGADFLCDGPEHLKHAREFATTRRVEKKDDSLSRLYVAEAVPTGTGSLADHRMALSPSRITALAVLVAREVLAQRPAAGPAVRAALASVDLGADDAELARIAKIVADDLVATPEREGGSIGSSVVVAGPGQPAAVHAIAAALNEALGAVGETVEYGAWDEVVLENPAEQMASLASRIGGEVSTVVCVDTNPAYDAPGSLGVAAAMARADAVVTLNVGPTETGKLSTWELNGTHFLEAWGDTRSIDGTIAPIQPVIAPLFEPANSGVEFIAMLAGESEPDGYAIVKASWQAGPLSGLSQDRATKAFRRALHDGVVDASAARMGRAAVTGGRLARGLGELSIPSPASASSLEVVFTAGRVGDGRYANVGWLQELPQVGTQVTWENPAVVSPKTAQELGVLPLGLGRAEGDLDGMYTSRQMPQGRMGTLSVPGSDGQMRTKDVPVWILPGMPDNVVHVQAGYGRTEAGLVGGSTGFNAYELAGGAGVLGGVTLARASGTETIASTQNHWSLEGRDSIVRAIDKPWWEKHAGKQKDKADKIYGTDRRDGGLNVAEQLGELAHTPDNVSAYSNPLNESNADPIPGARYSKGPQWGMTIDLASCTGCGVCTIACQSENNIPIVGRAEVAKGREMTWIRVDRYFTGDDLNAPREMIAQPVACVHCENAPCEVVCPVNATVHGPEGTNNMAYNRCIGTRYCANNCPYKVRRFNFFDYAVTKYNGQFNLEELNELVELPDQSGFNKNFIPPRLREKLDEISHMKMNPDVTVRSRGVMEKCTYCIQRVNAARQEVKIRDMWTSDDQIAPIPDGFFQTACQQACPTESIVFGDILDPASAVTKSRDSDRDYLLLGYLNTRPRTSYLMRVRNPNPRIGVYDDHDPLDHGGGHGGDSKDSHGGDGHGPDSHGGEGHGALPSFVDPLKKFGDDGYAMSLTVLS
ncbi:MAG: TAT-variant-translocated molybdopterin oxidoreductase [Planctomycetota bacterium]